jgi:hypothetical protein
VGAKALVDHGGLRCSSGAEGLKVCHRLPPARYGGDDDRRACAEYLPDSAGIQGREQGAGQVTTPVAWRPVAPLRGAFGRHGQGGTPTVAAPAAQANALGKASRDSLTLSHDFYP